jgi:hypothetical protein
MPVLIDCNFIVDSTNGNGLGIRSLKGAYVQNVFMHTSASPGLGNSNPQTPNIPILNPNPASGTIVVQLQDNYNRVLFGGDTIISPVGSSSNTPSAAHAAQVITSLGSTTLAQWQAAGVPAGLVPSVGMAFIAASASAIGGSGTVAPTAAAGSGVFRFEGVGDSNQASAPSILLQGFGAEIILQARAYSSGDAIVTPADGTVISLQFMLSNSSILIAGE